jgi:hypothetical protein
MAIAQAVIVTHVFVPLKNTLLPVHHLFLKLPNPIPLFPVMHFLMFLVHVPLVLLLAPVILALLFAELIAGFQFALLLLL